MEQGKDKVLLGMTAMVSGCVFAIETVLLFGFSDSKVLFSRMYTRCDTYAEQFLVCLKIHADILNLDVSGFA